MTFLFNNMTPSKIAKFTAITATTVLGTCVNNPSPNTLSISEQTVHTTWVPKRIRYPRTGFLQVHKM